MSTAKVSLGTKISFGVGDVFGGGAMTLVGIHYLFFLTEVVRISPALAGTAILLSKAWDAVSDPLMGLISDRTRTRFGRRRPYFLAGVPLIIVALLMLWYPVDFSREAHRFLFVLFAYLFFSTVVTMVLIPYYGLAPELTPDYNERSSLMAVRMVFSATSSILCAVLPLGIVEHSADVRTGYIFVGLVFGLLFGLPYLATFFGTREYSPARTPPRRINLKTDFVQPLRNTSFRRVLLMYTMTFVTLDVIMSVVLYFMTYYLGLKGQSNLILGSLIIFQIIGIPLHYAIAKRTSKRIDFLVSAVLWSAAMLASLFLRPGMGQVAVVLYGSFVGIGVSGVVIMAWSIFSDVPDIDELYSGRRREGIYSGIFTFARKASSAIALFAVSNLLTVAGYRQPSSEIVDGVTRITEQAQTAGFVLALRLLFALLPAFLLGFAVYQCRHFALTPDTHDRLRQHLEKKRNGHGTSQWTEDDRRTDRELRSLLIGDWSVGD